MKGMLSRPADALVPQFWRDPTLPFVEARSVEDGRHFCYAKHTHERSQSAQSRVGAVYI